MSDDEPDTHTKQKRSHSQERGRGRGRGSNRQGRGAKQRRIDNWRANDNKQFETERLDRLKKKCLAGLDEEKELQECIDTGETLTLLTSQTQCSTRGVFLNTLVSYQQLRRQYGQQIEALCPPIVACRAALLQLAYKYATAWTARDHVTLGASFDQRPFLDLEIQNVVKGYDWGFALTNITVQGVGKVHLDRLDSWPVIPSPEEDNDFMVPDPFLITAQNLRQMVVEMGPQGHAAAEAKAVFRAWNVLPNAVYNAQDTIQNVDAVVPNNWPTAQMAYEDLQAYQALTSFARKKCRSLVSRIDWSPEGSGAAVVTNNIGEGEPGWGVITVGAPPAQVTFTLQPSGSAYMNATHRIEKSIMERGAISLLGECLDTQPWSSRYADQAVQMMDYNWTFACSKFLAVAVK